MSPAGRTPERGSGPPLHGVRPGTLAGPHRSGTRCRSSTNEHFQYTHREPSTMQRRVSSPRTRKGFTLVELAVVIVIIGVLAAFGVPKFLNSVERSKAAEAFAYLSALRTAEERFQAKEGVYTEDVTKLDIKMQPPKYFTPGTVTA